MKGDYMKVKQIMSNNIICSNIFDSVLDVSKLMKRHNIGFIPIKDEDIVGVITDRDIAINIEVLDKETPISNIMSNSIISIDEEKSIDEALDIMSKYKIKRILVKRNNSYIGVLSLSDIIKYKDIIETLRIIFYISDNNNQQDSKIDDFYL